MLRINLIKFVSALLGLGSLVDISEEKAHEHPILGGLLEQTYFLFEESLSLGSAIQVFFSLGKMLL